MVEPHISAGHVCIDHMAVVLDVSLLVPSASRAPARAKRINVRSLADPQNSELVAHIINSSPRPAWDVDVSEHAAVVIDHLYRELVAAFPSQRGPYAHWIPLGEHVRCSQSCFVIAAMQCDTRSLLCGWLCCAVLGEHGSLMKPCMCFSAVGGCGSWRPAMRWGACCCARYGLLVRRACREDRNRMYAEIAEEIATSTPSSMHTAVQKVLKPKKYRKSEQRAASDSLSDRRKSMYDPD